MATPFHPAPNSGRQRQARLAYAFAIGELRLVPAESVLTEMIDAARIYPVPKAAAALVGTTPLRGNIIPVIDFEAASRATRQLQADRHRVLVFDRGDHSIGMLLAMPPELVSLVAPTGGFTRPASPLAEFLVRPWTSHDKPGQIWWEFNHRAAAEAMLQPAAASVADDAARVSSEFKEEFA